MTEEQYKKTLIYKMNELNLALAELLLVLSSCSNRLYKLAIKHRVSVIEKAEQDYYIYVEGLSTQSDGDK